MDLITFVYRVPEVFALLRIHENSNVAANTILFIDHSKAYAGKVGVQIREHVPYRFAVRNDTRRAVRV